LSLLLFVVLPRAEAQMPVLISSDPAGVPGNGFCAAGGSSFDGRWVAFSTKAPNLSPNSYEQVFVKDLATWGLEYVSLSTSGTPGNDKCTGARTSWDGRYVAFTGRASNLVAGDLNAALDVFVRDRASGVTTRESLGSSGLELNGESFLTDLSVDGRFVLFVSNATNVVPGIATGQFQPYLRDRWTGTVLPMAVSNTGALANGSSFSIAGGVSADGRYVVFPSQASNLVVGDTNGEEYVFLRDTWANTLIRISVGPQGEQGDLESKDPYISDDGSVVVFTSSASNLVTPDANGGFADVLVYDLATGGLERVDHTSGGVQADRWAFGQGLSWDGRFVSFVSDAVNLGQVPELAWDWDAFVYDRVLGTLEQVSPTTPEPELALRCGISPNGRFALLQTDQPWVPEHPAGTQQVYAVDRGPICITPVTYCTGKTNSLGCDPWVATYGCASASQDSGFTIYGGNVRNNKQGLLFYGLSGPSATPFQGGTMCVAAPRKRTPIRDSFGSSPPANDCSGVWSIDLNEFAAGSGGGHPVGALLLPGTLVDCQWWGRDPGAPFQTALSNAIEYLVGP